MKLLLPLLVFTSFAHAQLGWMQKADVGNPSGGPLRSSCVAFSINGKGYMGLGDNSGGGVNLNDFWQYDPASDTWTQKANFGGAARKGSVGFSIGNYGYAGLGWSGSGHYADFWQYDPSSNTWLQKTNFPGAARKYAGGATNGTYGFVGCGSDASNVFFSDFWQYDPVGDTWTAKANFIGGGRYKPVDFSLSGNIYFGLGRDFSTSTIYSDLWMYSPASNTWSQKANFPGGIRDGAICLSTGPFAYCGLGYDGTNYYNDFWRYNPVNDTWAAMPNFPGIAKVDAVGFSIGNTGYVGTGYYQGTYYKDFWAYFTQDGNSVAENGMSAQVSISPNPFHSTAILKINSPVFFSDAELHIYDVSGREVRREAFSGDQYTLHRNSLEIGVYFYRISTEKKGVAYGKFVVE